MSDTELTAFESRFSEALRKPWFPYDKISPSVNAAISLYKETSPSTPLPPEFFEIQRNIRMIARRTSKPESHIIRNFPDYVRELFENFDLLPEQDEPATPIPTLEPKTRRMGHARGSSRTIPVKVADVVQAATDFFAKKQLRPIVNSGPITSGPLAGTMTWSALLNYGVFASEEGMSSISEAFDLHGIGIKGIEKKMLSAFHTSFENAASVMQDKAQHLPYALQMLEHALAHTIAATASYTQNTIIKTNPLGKLQLTIGAVDDCFRKAAEQEKLFPFKNMASFIEERKIREKAREIMHDRAYANQSLMRWILKNTAKSGVFCYKNLCNF